MSPPVYSRGRGEGHREADPSALADLLSDGGAPARHRNGDPARRRGLLRHERGRVRAALLRRPRRARLARHPAARRQAGRGLLRAGELLARARGLPPPRDRVHRRASTRRCRPRCRCSTASSPTPSRCGWRSSRSPGGARARSTPPRSARSRSASPASAGGAELSARLAKIDTAIYRRKRIEFEYFTMQSRRGRRSAGSTPTSCSSRAASSTSSATRTSATRARVPALAHPRQGRLRDEGRARLPAPGRLRPARLREPDPLAARRHRRHRRGLGVGPHRLARRAQLRPLRRDGRRRGRDGRVFRTPYAIPRLVVAWALGYGEHARIAGPPELVARGARAARRDRRAPHAASRSRARRGRAAAVRGPRGGRGAGPLAPGGRDPARALRAPGHARLGADRGRPRGPAAAGRRGLRAAADLRAGAARGHPVLNVVNFGGGAYVLYAEVQGKRDRGRPRALLRHLRPAGAAAADRGQRAHGGDRLPRRAPLASTSRPRATRSRPRSARSAARACWSAAPAPTTPTSPATSAARSSRAT